MTLAFLSGFKSVGPGPGRKPGVRQRAARPPYLRAGPAPCPPLISYPSHPFPSRSNVVKCASSYRLIIDVN